MASTQSGRTAASTSAKTRCLTAISSNTASITKSASANASLVSDPVTRPVSRAAASGAIRPRAASLAISPCTWPTPASSRAWSRSVSTTGTSSLRANSSAICAAIRPAPTTPTLVTGRRERSGPGRRRPPAGPLLGEVERVERRVHLVAEQQVSERLVLGGERLVAGGVPGRGDQVDGPAGGGGGAVELALGEESRHADRLVPVFLYGRSGHGGLSGEDARGPAERFC